MVATTTQQRKKRRSFRRLLSGQWSRSSSKESINSRRRMTQFAIPGGGIRSIERVPPFGKWLDSDSDESTPGCSTAHRSRNTAEKESQTDSPNLDRLQQFQSDGGVGYSNVNWSTYGRDPYEWLSSVQQRPLASQEGARVTTYSMTGIVNQYNPISQYGAIQNPTRGSLYSSYNSMAWRSFYGGNQSFAYGSLMNPYSQYGWGSNSGLPWYNAYGPPHAAYVNSAPSWMNRITSSPALDAAEGKTPESDKDQDRAAATHDDSDKKDTQHKGSDEAMSSLMRLTSPIAEEELMPTYTMEAPPDVREAATHDNVPASAEPHEARKKMAEPRVLTKTVDDKIHTMAAVAGDTKSPATTTIVLEDSSEYELGESVQLEAIAVAESDYLTDLVDNVYCGHNVSLLIMSGKSVETRDSAELVASAVADAIFTRLSDNSIGKDAWYGWVSAAAFTSRSSACYDLLAPTEASTQQPCSTGTHPLCGPGMLGRISLPFNSSEKALSLIKKALAASNRTTLDVIQLKVKQRYHSSSGEGKEGSEMLLSSITLAFFSDESLMYIPSIASQVKSAPAALFSSAVGGSSRAVVVVPLRPEEDISVRKRALDHACILSAITNAPIRSGNVRRFIDFMEEKLQDQSGTASATRREASRQMLQDAKELINAPIESEPVIYGKPAMQPTPAEPHEGAEQQQKQDQEQHQKQDQDQQQDEEKDQERQLDEEKEEAPPQTSTANVDDIVVEEDVRALPHEKIAVAVVVEGASESKCAAHSPYGHTHPHEVIHRSTDDRLAGMITSDVFLRCQACVTEGYNVSIASAEMGPETNTPDQFTWQCFRSLLTTALDKTDPTEVFLYLSVIHQRTVVLDLVGGKDMFPLQVAASPLFGPVPNNTAHLHLTRSHEVGTILTTALEKATPFMQTESMLVAVAVCKTTMEDGDVHLSSIFVTSSPSTSFMSAFNKSDRAYSRALLSNAFGGASTTCVLVVTSEDLPAGDGADGTGDMDAAQLMARTTNLPKRDCSVRNYIIHMEASISKIERAIDDGGHTEKQLESLNRKLDMTRHRQEDHKRYMEPEAATQPPPAYLASGERQRAAHTELPDDEKEQAPAPSSASVPIDSVMIVWKDYDIDDSSLAVTDAEVIVGNNTFSPTEIVRVLKGQPVESKTIDKLVQQHLAGFNVAVISLQPEGDATAHSLTTRALTDIHTSQPTPDSQVFWSVAVRRRDGAVKDALVADSTYDDACLMYSPIFGPCYDNAPLRMLSIAEADSAIRGALEERDAVHGAVIVLAVSKIIKEADVLLPSCMFVLCGEDTDMITSTSESEGSHQGILQYALGGSCRTACVASVHAGDAEAAIPLLRATEELSDRVSNTEGFCCSVAQFVDYAQNAVTALEKEEPSADPNRDARLSSAMTMLNDAKKLIAEPGDAIPYAYLRQE